MSRKRVLAGVITLALAVAGTLGGCLSSQQSGSLADRIERQQVLIRAASATAATLALEEANTGERQEIRSLMRDTAAAVVPIAASGDVRPERIRTAVAEELEGVPDEHRRVLRTLYSSLSGTVETYLEQRLEGLGKGERARAVRALVLAVADGVQDAAGKPASTQEAGFAPAAIAALCLLLLGCQAPRAQSPHVTVDKSVRVRALGPVLVIGKWPSKTGAEAGNADQKAEGRISPDVQIPLP